MLCFEGGFQKMSAVNRPIMSLEMGVLEGQIMNGFGEVA